MTKLNNWNVENHILKEEEKLFSNAFNTIESAKHMMIYLNELLNALKSKTLKDGFPNKQEEINFFKKIKPNILGKLIFYNKVYRIETFSPSYSNSHLESYYLKKIEQLSNEFKLHVHKTDFYRYYNSQRTDKDMEYFTLGNIDFYNGLSSVAFEIDPVFSTYYDYKIARIIATELLNEFLYTRIQHLQLNTPSITVQSAQQICWSDSQNALIELIYALYTSSVINNGQVEIRKLAYLFEQLFNTKLSDIHHAFHKMKTRSTSRTIFLDKLKKSLEEYMDKE